MESTRDDHAFYAKCPIVGLPNEILEHIFDYVPDWVPAMVRLSHVCGRWRHLAHQHPNFCRDIYITDVDAEGMEILPTRIPGRTARIAAQLASSEQPLHVTIELAERGHHVITAALPLLPAHLHRVVSFKFVCHHAHHSREIITLLDAPTPMLESLCLSAEEHMLADDTWDIILPRSFLSGKSRLRSLALRSFVFRGDALASTSIEHLELRIEGDLAQIDRALSACPLVRRLDLSFRHWGPGMDLEDVLLAIGNERVVQLPIVSFRRGYELISLYAAVLETLHGPLRMTEFFCWTQRSAICFDATICDATSTRMFPATLLTLNNDGPELEAGIAAFRTLGIADRLVELRACVNAIDLVVMLFPVLPVLETLIIALRHRRMATTLYTASPGEWRTFELVDNFAGRVACPSLTKVVISGEGQSCSAAWLAHLVGHVLGVAPRMKLELVLKGTTMIDNPTRVWGYFKSISMCPAEQE